MPPLLIFLGILILAFIGANLFRDKLQSKFHLPRGIEYIFLGIIIGPSFSNWIKTFWGLELPILINDKILLQLSPGIATATGIIGLAYGLKFKLSDFQNADPDHIRITILDIIITYIFIGGAAFGVLFYLFYDQSNLNEIIASSFALAVIGSVSSNSLIKSIISKYSLNGRISVALDVSTKLNLDLNIFLFGLLFGIIHIGSNQSIQITPTEWIVISIVLAVLIGILLNLFLGREEDENKFFVAVIGITIFASGIAYFLNISPLYMNFMLGFVLANLSKISDKLEASVSKILEPFGILIVVMAGFYWVPSSLYTFLIAVTLFIFLRYFSKRIAGSIADASAFDQDKLVPTVGMGLLPQDIIVCAMVVDYLNVYKNDFTSIVVSSVLVSMIFYGLISYFLTKRLLIDAGEITGEIK